MTGLIFAGLATIVFLVVMVVARRTSPTWDWALCILCNALLMAVFMGLAQNVVPPTEMSLSLSLILVSALGTMLTAAVRFALRKS